MFLNNVTVSLIFGLACIHTCGHYSSLKQQYISKKAGPIARSLPVTLSRSLILRKYENDFEG